MISSSARSKAYPIIRNGLMKTRHRYGPYSTSHMNVLHTNYFNDNSTVVHGIVTQKPRFKSTSALSSSSSSSSSACPMGGGAKKNINSDDEKSIPAKKTTKLTHVPKLPFLGSIISSYSGLPTFDLSNTYGFYAGAREKFGDFYTFGAPGTGVGIFCTIHCLTDPDEMLKIIRSESQYPIGGISFEWPLITLLHDVKSPYEGFFGRGDYWKKLRRFLQSDMLSPAAAKGYVPGIIQAARGVSSNVVHFSKDVNTFSARASFDLFSSVMFGEMTRVTSMGLARNDGCSSQMKDDSNNENVRFCDCTVTALEKIMPLMTQPHLQFMVETLGIKTKMYKEFEDNMKISREIAYDKFRKFKGRKMEGSLNEIELNSYASLTIDRQASPNGEGITDEEVIETIILTLEASVDTTSSLLNWCIVHLAMNPSVQDKLYQELSATIQSTNNDSSKQQLITDAIISKSNTPYLHAILREQHRITPSANPSIIKDNPASDVTIHGELIPKGNVFFLDSRSIGMDPAIVPDCDMFRPERWIDENEINARRGTKAEVLDHPLYRDPFSAGARKCPGNRVAQNEVLVMLSQLVVDWKMSFVEAEKYRKWMDIPHFHGLVIQPKVPEIQFEPRR